MVLEKCSVELWGRSYFSLSQLEPIRASPDQTDIDLDSVFTFDSDEEEEEDVLEDCDYCCRKETGLSQPVSFMFLRNVHNMICSDIAMRAETY